MENTVYFYRKILLMFTQRLIAFQNYSNGSSLCEDSSTEELEAYILEQKEVVPTTDFYYEAGFTVGSLLQGADSKGGYSNAYVGGVSQFEDFIGIEE